MYAAGPHQPVFLGSCLLGMACIWLPSGHVPAEESSRTATAIGKQLAGFSLQDYRGRVYTLEDFRDRQLLVLAFLGTDCPLAKQYGVRLAELDRRYGPKGVAIVGVNSNVQDSPAEIAAYARRLKIEFPILKDVGNRLADQLGAQRTPEVVLLDANCVVRYQGRIDDQFGIGVVRAAPERRYLEEAIEELLSGKEVSHPEEPAEGCLIGRVRPTQTSAPVTYSSHVAGILHRHCVSCHRPGEIAPFALTDYQEVAGWAEMIWEVIQQGRMPPWHASPQYGKFRNDNRLTDEEKQLVRAWVEAGAPLGDPHAVPPLPTFTTGWQLPREPDLVIKVTPQPFRVPATGEVRYQYFSVDPHFTEDRWIAAAELRPGNRAVVHHILAFARQGPFDADEAGVEGFLVGYVPGLRVEPLPSGMAKRVPAGSKLVFQLHYTPIGTEQEDQSELGLIFADPKEITHEVITTSVYQRKLRIPPGAAAHRAEATGAPLPYDALLLCLMPHMHLRGKSFLYEAIYPDGTREILLDVPRYDFNWQTAYRLAEPKLLPSGTKIHCVACYDNSAKNLNNPDPTRLVTWGAQTWDEMMIGYFDIALPVEVAREHRLSRQQLAQRLLHRLDRNMNGAIDAAEVPPAYRATFDRLDTDKDGKLTEQEIIQAQHERRS